MDRLTLRVFAGVFPVVMASLFLQLALIASGGNVRPIDTPKAVSITLLSGLCAMIAVETLKRLVPIRGAYNRRQTAKWLDRRRDTGGAAMGQLVRAMTLHPDVNRTVEVSVQPENKGDPINPNADMDQALGTSWASFAPTGEGVAGAFNLPAEQLSAQLSGAIERAWRTPEEFRALLRAMCPRLTDEDLSRLAERKSHSDRTDDASAYLAYDLPSAIDQLQIHLAGRWRQYLQATSWWLAGAFGLVLAVANVVPETNPFTATLVALAFGGFVAWLSRDLAAVVERLRR